MADRRCPLELEVGNSQRCFPVPVFAVVTIGRGLDAMTRAVLAETFVCAIYSGSYAAVVQYIRNRRPLWLTAFIIAVALPALGQVIEYEVHTWRSTPHRILAVTISSILSVLSSLFNWYVMRQETFLVGRERTSFIRDFEAFTVTLVGLLAPRAALAGPTHRIGRSAFELNVEAW